MNARIAIIVAIFLAGFGTAWVAQGWRFGARINGIEARQHLRDAAASQAYADAERKNRERLQAAQDAADQSIADAQARADAANQQTLEIQRELNQAHATTGRPCLSAAARGLLQQSPAFGHRAGLRLPDTAASPASAATPAATDSGHSKPGTLISSDTDMANWVSETSALYETCRARIDGLRAWAESSH